MTLLRIATLLTGLALRFEADRSIGAGTFALEVHRFSVFYPGMVGTPAPSK